MNLRHVARTVGIGAAIAAGGLLFFAGTAGAGLPSGSQVSNGVIPINPDPTSGQSLTPGTPFSSGQTVTVQAPSGPFTSSTNVNLVECEAPNGVLPTQPTQCDPANTKSADTILANANGGFTYSLYQIFALPDPNLSPSTIVCGNTTATECVVGMFADFTNFTAPHLFSQPFLVVPSAGDQAANPGDGTPEVPLAIGLPLAAAGLMAGGIAIRRRRASRSTAA
jgi:hypothetical protein